MIKLRKLANSAKTGLKTLGSKVRGKRWLRGLLILIVAGLLLFLVKTLFIAAFVNGWPVSRIAVIKELEKQGGKNVLDQLIEKALISQEANSKGIRIEKAVVDTEVTRIEALLKEQNLSLDEALTMRGETRASLYSQIELQKKVEELLKDKITVTDGEVEAYFKENTDLFAENAKFEEVKDSAKDQLYQQKLNEVYSSWIEELRAKADIVYLLKFQ